MLISAALAEATVMRLAGASSLAALTCCVMRNVLGVAHDLLMYFHNAVESLLRLLLPPLTSPPSCSSPKNKRWGAPGGNNWSKAPRKSRRDYAQASARAVTTPSATGAGYCNQQAPLRSGSPTIRQEDVAMAGHWLRHRQCSPLNSRIASESGKNIGLQTED